MNYARLTTTSPNNEHPMLLTDFINNTRDNHLFSSSGQLLLTVSGGVDSVVLCELCYRAGLVFQIAHVNFELRGEESESDEMFVRQLAEKYKVPVHVRKINAKWYAEEKKLSIQVAARESRYAWFEELLDDELRCIVTAHHADDNIETVLMNFFRGTGIAGLRGMLPVTGNVVRPLLPFSREEILQFAKEHKLAWREDSSNLSEKYSRNRFRHTIIPLLKEVYPEAEQNLLDNIRRFADIEVLYHQAIDLHKKKLVEHKGNEAHIPVRKLLKASPPDTIVYEIIKDYGFTSHQADEVRRLLSAGQGKLVQSATHRIIRNRDWLIISPNINVESEHVLIEEGEEEIQFEKGIIEIRKIAADKVNISGSPMIAFFDKGEIEYPLLLRKWKQGDYFYPFGLRKKKKISRFLIDQKLSPTEKEKVWVIESGERICWVVGRRIDDRFKIKDSTKFVLALKCKE
jgi:tRNA(Ile)-lysidine synthase